MSTSREGKRVVAEFTNIHHAIARLSSFQVTSYLTGRGWRLDDRSQPGVFYFENENEAGESLRFWIWESPEQPKYRSQLQNLLFGLSVFEQREPLDVANEICEVPLAAVPPFQPEQATPKEAFVRLRNRQNRTLYVVFQGVPRGAIAFYPSDCLEVRFLDQAPEIDLADEEVVIHATPKSPIQILYRAGHSLEPTQSIAQRVDELLTEEACDLSESARGRLAPTLARLEFEIDREAKPDEGGQRARQRQTACLATTLAKPLVDSPQGRRVIWRLCAELLDGVGLALIANETAMDQLFATAQQDDEIMPRRTLDWLTQYSANVANLEAP